MIVDNRTRPVIALLILSAASGMLYQVAITNILFYRFVLNSYSISMVLSIFLFGLGFGSYYIHRQKNKILDKRKLLYLFQVILALYSTLILSRLPSLIVSSNQVSVVLTSITILLIPTCLLGATFPLAGLLLQTDKKNNIGLIYSIDLVGAVIGAMTTGFLLIPHFGNITTLLAGSLLNLLAALSLSTRKEKLMVSASAILTVLTAWQLSLIHFQIPFIASPAPIQFNKIDQSVLFDKPSPYGEVSIKNGKLFIGTRQQCTLEYSQGEIEIVDYVLNQFKSKNLKVANIGLGCGKTASTLIAKVSTPVDIIEINPVVVEANHVFSDLLKNPQANLIQSEGLQYLRDTKQKYDAIIVDIEEPSVIHASNIYTQEAFETIRNSLKPDGIFGLWKYTCGDPRFNDTIYNTLKTSFKHVYIPHEFVMIASNRPLQLQEYVPNTNTNIINTLDKKPLSQIYFDKCSAWFQSDKENTIMNFSK